MATSNCQIQRGQRAQDAASALLTSSRHAAVGTYAQTINRDMKREAAIWRQLQAVAPNLVDTNP